MSDTFAKGVRLHQLLQTLLKDYPLRTFLPTQSSHMALAVALVNQRQENTHA